MRTLRDFRRLRQIMMQVGYLVMELDILVQSTSDRNLLECRFKLNKALDALKMELLNA